MVHRKFPHQLTYEDIFLPFGAKLFVAKRWIQLPNLNPWDELEDDDVAQFVSVLEYRQSHLVLRLVQRSSRLVWVSRMKDQKTLYHVDTRGIPHRIVSLRQAHIRQIVHGKV